jgi:hypothetical protein
MSWYLSQFKYVPPESKPTLHSAIGAAPVMSYVHPAHHIPAQADCVLLYPLRVSTVARRPKFGKVKFCGHSLLFSGIS